MSEEKDAFYVVKKGDVVGIYKSLSDVQVHLASSVSDGSLKIYKGYSLSKNAEEYLASHGLKEAAYSIGAADVSEGLFGGIFACPYQQPYHSGGKASDLNSPSKRLRGPDQLNNIVVGSSLFSTNSERRQIQNGAQSDLSTCLSCILEFDGAAKGNPGPAGAGAVLRAEDGSMVCQLREGLGMQTNNVAEYRALILGLKHAIRKGYKHIRVQGDSLLVCNQMKGLWKTKNANMAYLCNEAKELKDKFLSFQINHIPREYNSKADAQANLAINLKAGQVEEDCKLLDCLTSSSASALALCRQRIWHLHLVVVFGTYSPQVWYVDTGRLILAPVEALWHKWRLFVGSEDEKLQFHLVGLACHLDLEKLVD